MPRETRYSRPKSDPNESLLQFLLRRFGYLTDEQWRAHISDGHLHLNGVCCTDPDRTLRQGDRILFQPPRSLEPRVDETHIEVVLEDASLVVCAKNGELPVTEGGRYCENTLVSVLLRRGTACFTLTADSAADTNNNTSTPSGLLSVSHSLKRARDDSTPQTGQERDATDASTTLTLFPVHRLDKETSGLLVMGKTLDAAQTLSQQFEHQSTALLAALSPLFAADEAGSSETARCAAFANLMGVHKHVVKTYLAVVSGTAPVGTVRVVTQRIGRLSEDPSFATHPAHQKLKKLKMACFASTNSGEKSAPGKPAVSRVTWLRTDHDARLSLVEVSLLTGRTHQIRLHCAHLGYPVVGDKLYSCHTLGREGDSFAAEDDVYMDRAKRSETESLPDPHHPDLLCKRHLLHAAHLSFQHPTTGDVVELSSPAAQWFLRDVMSTEGGDSSLVLSLKKLVEGF